MRKCVNVKMRNCRGLRLTCNTIKIPNDMRYKGSAAAETMMTKAASLFGQ